MTMMTNDNDDNAGGMDGVPMKWIFLCNSLLLWVKGRWGVVTIVISHVVIKDFQLSRTVRRTLSPLSLSPLSLSIFNTTF